MMSLSGYFFRGMKHLARMNTIRYSSTRCINYGLNETEPLVTKNDFPVSRCRGVISNRTISVLGYGTQGRSQALNIRDNNLKVIIGVRKDGNSWENAKKDGWIPGVDLFEIDEAANRGRIIKFLLSDSGQVEQWKNVKDNLNMGDTLYFSHGFGVHYYNYTNINPPEDVNVVMVSPKCSGNTVRRNFNNRKGFASSYAVYKDFDGTAEETCLSLAFLIGNNYVFETSFENEVVSDLTGERCVLMGLIQGAFLAQYKVLRGKGHSPCEAYHETIEEALQSLYPLIGEKGMDWLYHNCSATAQRGALDWAPRFEKKIAPLIEECYNSVKTGTEVKRVLECNSKPDHREELDKELDAIRKQEMWDVGNQIITIRRDIQSYNRNDDNRTYRYNGALL
jgi:ketol-acid reductoisomerase